MRRLNSSLSSNPAGTSASLSTKTISAGERNHRESMADTSHNNDTGFSSVYL